MRGGIGRYRPEPSNAVSCSFPCSSGISSSWHCCLWRYLSFSFPFSIILFFCVFLINFIQTFCRFWTPYGIAGESIYPYPQNGTYHSKMFPSLAWISLSHHNTFDFNVFFFCRNSGQQFRRGCRRCLSHSCFYLSRYFSFLCFFGICVSKYRHPMCSLCRSEHASTIILRTFLSARVMSCLRKKKVTFWMLPIRHIEIVVWKCNLLEKSWTFV